MYSESVSINLSVRAGHDALPLTSSSFSAIIAVDTSMSALRLPPFTSALFCYPAKEHAPLLKIPGSASEHIAYRYSDYACQYPSRMPGRRHPEHDT